MAIKYPILIPIFIVLFVIVYFFKGKRKEKRNNIKVANTNIIKRTEYYKSVLAKYRLSLYFLYAALFIGVLGTSFLFARVYKRTIISEEKYNRDIILCLDVSTSTDQLNMELTDKYLELVDELKGERIGISIFNSTSFTLVPLTEDYDYIKDSLDKINSSLRCRHSWCFDSEKYNYLITGTLTTYGTDQYRGSSLVGDGLASCIYAFPKLEEKRTRSIVLVTDNDVLGEELISVVDAAKIAKKKDITIYTISPKNAFKKDVSSLQEAAKITGGKSYSQVDDVDRVVDEINKKETTLLEGHKQELEYDHPTIPLLLVLLSFGIVLFIDKEMIV